MSLTAVKLLLSGWGSDFVVIFGETRYRLHRPILADHSGFFRAMFSGSPRENEVDFTDHYLIDQKSFDWLIEYWYEGTVDQEVPFPEAFDLPSIRTHLVNVCEYFRCKAPRLFCQGKVFDKNKNHLLGTYYNPCNMDAHLNVSRSNFVSGEEGKEVRKDIRVVLGNSDSEKKFVKYLSNFARFATKFRCPKMSLTLKHRTVWFARSNIRDGVPIDPFERIDDPYYSDDDPWGSDEKSPGEQTIEYLELEILWGDLSQTVYVRNRCDFLAPLSRLVLDHLNAD